MVSNSYDGPLLTGTTWSGAVSGKVGFTYDNDFRITAESVNGGSSVSYGYDGDGLIASAGAMTISRGAQNGRIGSNPARRRQRLLPLQSFGEVTSYTASPNGAPVLALLYTRDAVGRISTATETSQGATVARGYGYDDGGRLTTTTQDGVAHATYSYDSNSNRLSVADASCPNAASYDDEDRLLTYGATSYSYSNRGDLQLDYDEFGNVLSDSNPDFQPFGFAGGLYDRNTGLVRFGARDYDPSTGRFMTKDPKGFAGGDTNLYGYVVNDPINLIDPMGTDWLDDHTDQIASFSAGLGSVLSFGITDIINNATGASAVVDRCSTSFKAGEWSGVALLTAIGGAEGLEEGTARGAGEEWSHWIPDRFGQRASGWIPDAVIDSELNGQYVSTAEHGLTDFWRRPRGTSLGEKYPPPVQQWMRIPPWVKGGAAGAGLGGLSVIRNASAGNCGCK